MAEVEGAPAQPAPLEVNAAFVRAWARRKNIKGVGQRGHLPDWLIERFNRGMRVRYGLYVRSSNPWKGKT